MWRNKESEATSSSTASGRGEESSNPARVPTNSGSATAKTTQGSSWLSSTMKVTGEISGDEDLVVDGGVEGPISVGEHRLTVGQNGQVTGGLAAREIVIYGKVDGNRSVVSESIEIKKNASMIGNVTTRRIVIEDGAAFKGSIEIQESDKEAASSADNAARALSHSA